jgi:hypothetical protein
MRIITDPSDRQGLSAGTLVDWIETIAIAPFLFAAIVGVVLLATLLRRREPSVPHTPEAAGADHPAELGN